LYRGGLLSGPALPPDGDEERRLLARPLEAPLEALPEALPEASPEPPRIIAAARAVLSGLFLAIVGEMALGLFYLVNLYLVPHLPWAVVPAGLFVIWLWRYLAGVGRPESERRERRALLRARALPVAAWGWALVAAASGLTALRGLSVALAGLGQGNASRVLPTSVLPGLPVTGPGEPDMTLWLLFAANSVLFAPLIEEAAFRGYMQVPIEGHYGPRVALPAVALVFTLLHAGRGTPWVYLGLALLLGALAWRSGSIWPGVVVHGAANLWSLVPTWPAAGRNWLAAALDHHPAVVAVAGGLVATGALVGLGRRARGAAPEADRDAVASA